MPGRITRTVKTIRATGRPAGHGDCARDFSRALGMLGHLAPLDEPIDGADWIARIEAAYPRSAALDRLLAAIRAVML